MRERVHRAVPWLLLTLALLLVCVWAAQADPPAVFQSAPASPGPTPAGHPLHHRPGANAADVVRLFLSGPAALLLVTSALALTALAAATLGRSVALVGVGQRAAERLERGAGVPALWGVAALVLALAAGGILLNIHPLALLGVLALLAGFLLLGVGAGVAALRLGRLLADALGSLGDDLAALRLGLSVLFLAEFVPFLGWLFVALACASGVGATLEALLARKAPSPQ